MALSLKGRGLFIFSDPGGAKPLLAFVQSIKDELIFFKIISDRKYSFFFDFNVVVDEPILSIESELQLVKPDFIFVATSYTSKIELKYLKEAKKLAIKSFAFIDHWTSLKERFILDDKIIYPDSILVVDEHAKTLAIQDGIPKNIIAVFGNPYHKFISEWKPSISKDAFFSQLGLCIENKKCIIYAPDPLSNVNGYLEYGFDEISATIKLSESIKELDEKYVILLKTHPNQNLFSIKKTINNQFLLLPIDVDTNTLIYYSDVVVGFFSNFLIEASILKKPVLRFLIDGYKKDPFELMHFGQIVHPNTLAKAIKSIC